MDVPQRQRVDLLGVAVLLVLFQGFLTLRPGVYTVSVMVRDRNSPASARRERTDTVPRLAGPALAEPVPSMKERAGRRPAFAPSSW